MNSLTTHRAFSGEACQFLFSTLLVLLHLDETLVYRSLGSLGLGDLFWVGPCPEAGHGGSCFRDPTPPLSILSLLLAVTRFPWKVVKNNTSKRTPKSTQNGRKGSPIEARKDARIMTKHILSQNVWCVFDTVKHILYSHSRSATQRENLRSKVPKTDDSVGVSIYIPNLQISQKSPQIGVPVDRPFRTFQVICCTFCYLVPFWTLQLLK